MLSSIPALLKAKAPSLDYKATLGDVSLKTFIRENGPDNGYKLVEHPTQLARVAIVPSDAEFTFQAESAAEVKDLRRPSRRREVIVVAFLRELATLPDSDLESINIPLSTIVKLLKN